MPKHGENDRLSRMRCSLEGLSVGDAFGEGFFVNPDLVEGLIEARALPAPPWRYTDDTLMALSIVWVLQACGEIDQDRLARSFAEHYDRSRDYGPAMHRLLAAIREGDSWYEAASGQFSGQGSFGNGAAMRVAPLGAFFAEDMDAVIEQARRSAEITHTHREGIAGAVAVAVASAWAWRLRRSSVLPSGRDFLDLVLPLVPDSEVHEKIRHARNLAPGASVRLAVEALGNGVRISAQDTVPFALWCAAQHLNDYEQALWLTVSGLGDRDTTCAIAGGIVSLTTGREGIPSEWLLAREALPEWPFAAADQPAGDE